MPYVVYTGKKQNKTVTTPTGRQYTFVRNIPRTVELVDRTFVITQMEYVGRSCCGGGTNRRVFQTGEVWARQRNLTIADLERIYG